MYGESGRRPSRIGSMAGFTGYRKVQRNVIRIDTLIVVCLVACCTGVGCIVVITLVTIVT